MIETVEQASLILEDQLLDHLATEEGAMAIYKERLDPVVIGEGDEIVRNILEFVYNYIREHRQAPGAAVLRGEFGTTDFLPPETPVSYVVEKLRERYKRNEMQKVVAHIAKLTNTEPAEAARYAFGEFSRIRIQTMPRKHESSPEDYVQRVADYKERVLTKSIKGVTLGWPQVDDDLMGLREKTLTGVIGRPKQGKSWFLLQSANAAWQENNEDDFVFDTLELSIQEMEDRHLCMVAGVGYGRFMRGTLEGPEQKSLAQAADYIATKPNRLHFLRPDVGDRTVPYMLQQAMEMDSKALYLDQLSWIDPSKHFKDAKWREVEYTMAELKGAAEHLPVYFAAQFNRQAASMNEMGDLSQIGLSDSIGQTCDMLLGIYSSRDMRANQLVEFGVIEARAFERVRYEMKFGLDGEHYIKFLNRKEE